MQYGNLDGAPGLAPGLAQTSAYGPAPAEPPSLLERVQYLETQLAQAEAALGSLHKMTEERLSRLEHVLGTDRIPAASNRY